MRLSLARLLLLLLACSAGCSLSHNPDLPSLRGGDGDLGDGDFGDGDLGDGDGGDGDSPGDGDGDGDGGLGGSDGTGGAAPDEPVTPIAGSSMGGLAGSGTEEE